jgi:hypothetical protein
MGEVSSPTSAPIAERWRRLLSRSVDLVALAVVVFGTLFLAEKLEVERFPISDGIVFGVLLFYEGSGKA